MEEESEVLFDLAGDATGSRGTVSGDVEYNLRKIFFSYP
jgi:hypothetical protein